MSSKRRHEGYLLIDHSNSPGLPDQAMPEGMPSRSGQTMFEAPTITCNHCQTIVVINPQRNRERAWCRYCDHYLCDKCGGILAATGVCYPYKNFEEDLLEQNFQLLRND